MTWTTFEVTGAGLVGWERGDGDLLALVLHGGPGLTDYTESLADEILAGGDGRLRGARYQQRGQYPSTTDGPLTVNQFVADVIAVLDHLDAPTAVLVGHSWGGHLAMHAAVAAPERVAGLLLLDSLGGVGDGGVSTMEATIISRLGDDVVAELLAIDERTMAPTVRETAKLRLKWPGYFGDPSTAPPMPPLEVDGDVNEAVMNDAIAMLRDRVLTRALPHVTMPSVHVIGRQSPIEPTANEKTAALMPGSIVELQDAGHFAWIEQPGSVAAATRRLLDAMA